MSFESILNCDAADDLATAAAEAPAFFRDLNLDRIVAAIISGWEDYDLTPFFHANLTDLAAITYRQEVMRDLDGTSLKQVVRTFSARMRAMRERRPRLDKHFYKHERERRFLAAVEVYCTAVADLLQQVEAFDPGSLGLREFRDYLAGYVGSDAFRQLETEMSQLTSELGAIRYELIIGDNSVTVLPYEQEADYSAVVEVTFERFRQGAAKDYRVDFATVTSMNHVEAQVAERVALMHPALFSALEAFCLRHADYPDAIVCRFDREVQFYIAYLDHVDKLRRAGLRFCYPRLSASDKTLRGCAVFDMALADKLIATRTAIVANDFFMEGQERVFVVSGPNQGGKTTFARAFGQVHYLAALGCPVPGTEAQLFLFDQLFTHFEKEEDIRDLRGKLQDDLVRIRKILDRATPNSIVVMNEVFASTTLKDAVFLSEQVMARISRVDLLAVCVTFLQELASFDEKTVSLVSAIDPDDPAVRTYKVERRPANGLAYALALARKHRVTYDLMKKRLEA